MQRRASQHAPDDISRTACATGVSIHEGKGHPFILLQGALICETALHGTQVALLLPVRYGRLVHVDRFPDQEPIKRGIMERNGK